MSYLGKVVYLTDAQFQTLLTNGTITVDGVTVTYSEDDLYVTPTGELIDVQVNGSSVVNNGVANIPLGSNETTTTILPPGVVRAKNGTHGILIDNNGYIKVASAGPVYYKPGTNGSKPVVPAYQHQAVFYGLAKAAGHDENNSTEEFGTYTDEAKQAIQTMLGTNGMIAPVEDDISSANAYAVGDLFCYNGKLYQATAAIAVGDYFTPNTNCVEVSVASAVPHDVQVNGTSVVTNGVANIPVASELSLGLVKAGSGMHGGIGVSVVTQGLYIDKAVSSAIKAGTNQFAPIVTYNQHEAVFFGLSKLAGVDLASETVTVGTYPAASKTAIQTMLGVESGVSFIEDITSTTPTIIGDANTIYQCGTVTSISITPPAVGTIDVIFTSGSTPAVLTIPSTVKFPDWIDLSSLSINTVYEITITNGMYGGVMTWGA